MADDENAEVLAAQQQLEELECMLSMFPDAEELVVNLEAQHALQGFVGSGGSSPARQRPPARLQYTLRFKDLSFGGEVPELTLTCPHTYPAAADEIGAALEFQVRCPQLSRELTGRLQQQLTALASGACAMREVVGLQLYQEMHDFLSEAQAQQLDDQEEEKIAIVPPPPTPVVLGRRAIYFHHIIASNKRRVVKEWALELQLGGCSKIGWPGIVIVEGPEANVQEYVRRLQHLRWKQMVVRGMQTEEIGVNDDPEALDAHRRLPRGFREFPESGMSALAAACREAGLEELFLTSMKIYGRGDDAEPTQSLELDNARKKKGKQAHKNK